MPAAVSTISVLDAAGTPVAGGVRAIDESGAGAGPWQTAFTWLGLAAPAPYQARVDYDGAVAVKQPLVDITATFNRPADTTAYAVGDLVANSTTAGSVTAMQATGVARADQAGCRSFYIRQCRLSKSGASITNATFRVHLYKTNPTPANGDNGAWSTTRAGYLGSFDVIMDRAFTDGASGIGTPNAGLEIAGQLASGTTVYALIEARGAYTPASAETFAVELSVFQG